MLNSAALIFLSRIKYDLYSKLSKFSLLIFFNTVYDPSDIEQEKEYGHEAIITYPDTLYVPRPQNDPLLLEKVQIIPVKIRSGVSNELVNGSNYLSINMEDQYTVYIKYGICYII